MMDLGEGVKARRSPSALLVQHAGPKRLGETSINRQMGRFSLAANEEAASAVAVASRRALSCANRVFAASSSL